MLGALGQCLLSLLVLFTAARAQQIAQRTQMETRCRVGAGGMQAMQGQCLPSRPAPSTATRARRGEFAQQTQSGIMCPAGAPAMQALQGRWLLSRPAPFFSSSCPGVVCPANSNRDNVPAGCPCNSGYAGTVAASTITPFLSGLMLWRLLLPS